VNGRIKYAAALVMAFVIAVAFAQTETQTRPSTGQKPAEKPKPKAGKVEVVEFIAPKVLDTTKVYFYATKDVWIKETPSAEGKRICKAAKNSVFVQLEKAEKGWIKVEGMKSDSTKVQGYIYRNFLAKYPPTEQKAKPQKTQTPKQPTTPPSTK